MEARGVIVAVEAELVRAAAEAGAATGRTPAEQFAYWVRLGMEFERDRAVDFHVGPA